MVLLFSVERKKKKNGIRAVMILVLAYLHKGAQGEGGKIDKQHDEIFTFTKPPLSSQARPLFFFFHTHTHTPGRFGVPEFYVGTLNSMVFEGPPRGCKSAAITSPTAGITAFGPSAAAVS